MLSYNMILIPFKAQGMGWAHVTESIIGDSSTSVKGGRLCKFYIKWKLQKAANDAGSTVYVADPLLRP
jgi:hypothetical protein